MPFFSLQEIDLACSGRGPLDWSVLNDEWVAYATWASEGTSAHRKNQYEEAMYNAEQERHWYSFHIESNLRTIAYLEPLAARIAHMTPDERSAFKLPKGFEDGTAPSVYERIIRKIYGKDHGWEILMGLFESPATAVPLVLSRLKQKDEEWKRAEREWNKIWREVVSARKVQIAPICALTILSLLTVRRTTRIIIERLTTRVFLSRPLTRRQQRPPKP